MARLFSIASYNILAKSGAKPLLYPNVDPRVLRWSGRRYYLDKRVEGFDTDIICLQEVEPDAYSWLKSTLHDKGYDGIYAKKRSEKRDGCAIFFRHGDLRFVGNETIYYRDGHNGTPHSGHLALIISFEREWGVLRVATTHLSWDQEDKPPEEHIGYRQIRELIDDHIKPDRAGYEWIVCGDLNAQPDSSVVKELLGRGLVDAYAGREQSTCNSNRKAKRIDYLFHTFACKTETAKLMEIDDLTPLPSAKEPSDHLPIAAAFWKG